ncbi:UDP-N-acetylmuramoyl-tripeptide--D-alanyl-D-alanine ligase [Cognatishimia sp. MH4019]|uniref:UDP-N-acetylmuramoyl-tripeptide--D-alanyl-D- alanine ligase n=1 Tax=Cognatishimia sp. MH4019 TaxID=2854030 RepID=UPI001CD50D4E|nr:UDP-N-acetylmuramoyl-tripeptide--D-alanyl-D-alanine ligase [Cognatishimia sp. MH4019]
MTALWTAAEAAAATGGEARGDWSCTGVSIDTRTLEPGDLFVALKDARDGHDFVAQALDKGAGAALVSRIPEGVAEDAPLLIVEDVLTGLEALGRAARARTKARVVGVTGSVGKTSTKEMLRDVLRCQGRTHASVASYNNHWGVPLTLARMPADTEFAVIEMGMSNPGEIAPLSQMARPHVAMVTTVAAAHLEAFESIDGIAVEKASIMAGLLPNGVVVLNADVPTRPTLEHEAAKYGFPPVWFGQSSNQFTLKSVTLQGDRTIVQASCHGQPVLFKLSTAGRHFAMNGLGVLAVVEALGADIAVAALDLALWVPPAGRGARLMLQLDPVEADATVELIDDAYNANPTSMFAALEVLAAAQVVDNVGRVSKGRRIAVLGDMLELGAEEAQMHAAMAADPSLEAVSKVHCVGPRMRAMYDALPDFKRGRWVETADELAVDAHRLVDPGDVILVKGSLGSRVGRVVDALKKLGHPVEQPQDRGA